MFSRGIGSRSAGLGSVQDSVCFKYYGVSTEEIFAGMILSTAYMIMLPVLDTAES